MRPSYLASILIMRRWLHKAAAAEAFMVLICWMTCFGLRYEEVVIPSGLIVFAVNAADEESVIK